MLSFVNTSDYIAVSNKMTGE